MAGMANKSLKISDKEAYRVLGLPLGVDKEAIMKKYKSLSVKLSAGKTPEERKKLDLVVAAYNRLLPPQQQTKPNHKGQSGACNGVASEGSSEDDSQVSCRNGEVRSILSQDPAEMTEEEKERRRAEKKRAKKKRQKEKKKMEKTEPQTVTQKPVTNNRKREESPSEEEEEDEEEDEEEEDEEEGEEGQGIDPNSAFVAAAAAKRGVLGGGPAKEKPPRLTPQPPTPPQHHHHHHHHPPPRATTTTPMTAAVTANINNNIISHETGRDAAAAVPDVLLVKACQLARRGNEAASVGQYVAAVKLFSDAIALDPNDHRFFGNRSYCLNQLGHHEPALEDAKRAVLLAPHWAKGHFRCGTSLKDLKRYVEAERAFEEVLRLDIGCREAQEEVVEVRTARIREMGFTEAQAINSIAKYSLVQPALDALLSGEFKEGMEEAFRLVNTEESVKKTRFMAPRDVKMNPQNPEGLTSLWVGNVVPEVTEKALAQLFASHGQVTSVRLLREKYCAFVNYADKGNAGRAMAQLQGHVFGGQKLLIKFPDNPVTSGFYGGSGGINGKASTQENINGARRAPFEAHFPPSYGSSSASSASSSSSSSPSPLLSSSTFAPKNMTNGGGGDALAPCLTNSPHTTTTTTPVPLMSTCNGVPMTSLGLSLLPPPTQPPAAKLKGPVNGDECYFWRTTGCKFRDVCIHRHVQEHRGIDRKPWQK